MKYVVCRGQISETKMFREKLRSIVANPELGTLSTNATES
jgi:hypothetical protein